MPGSEDPFWQPLSAVWDNIHKAEFFITKARGSDIPLEWCLESIAGGLWAAIAILNDEVLQERDKLAESTTAWFRENGPLVLKIRLAVEHYKAPYGIGQQFTPRPGRPGVTVDPDGIAWHTAGSREGEGDTVETFVWIAGSEYEEIPVDDALSQLAGAGERVRQVVSKETREEIINFHTETRRS